MLLVRKLASVFFAVAVLVTAGAALGQLDRQAAIEARTQLADETITGERPPPSGQAPLADIPLRSRYPSTHFLPGLPQVGIFDPADALADRDETQIIQLVYDTYSRYSERDDGERVEFELDEFRTVYRPQFARVAYYPELMSLLSDWRLEAVISNYRMNDEPMRVRYEAEWVPGRDYADRPDVRALVGMSALEMIDLVSQHFPKWRRTIAITSYRVRVTFLGRTETYRAGFVWMLDEERHVRFSVVDSVVPQVASAVSEDDLPAAEYERRRELELPFDSATAASTSNSCQAQSWPKVNSTQMVDYNAFQHTDGRHEAVYIGEFACSCDASCLSRCVPGLRVAACQDYGGLTKWGLLHQAEREVEAVGDSSQDGHLTPARCASGMGCFVLSCIGSSCGGTDIKISGGIGGLSFSTSSPTILSASLSWSHLCGACAEAEPEPEPEPAPAPSPTDGCNTDGVRQETESGTCCQGECTPILLDLGGGAFELSGPVPAVVFDIDADGVAEALSWTRAGGDEAFLALDRDGNGVIDSGAELFGAATEQPPSADPNGFRALAVFDGADHGGDGDGAITAADAVYARLLLWVDADRDGVSSPQELRSPADLGVEEIGLDYVLSERRDRWGNRFRWSGRAADAEGRPVALSDVVFVSAPRQSDTR